MPAPIKIEAPWVSIDLDDHVVLGAGPEHLLDIDFVAWPPLELPPGHVADDGGVRIGDGREQALRLAFRSSLKRPWMLATTKSKRSSTLSG